MQHEQFDTKQPLFLQVVEVLTPQRDRLDAVLIFPSMPEVNFYATFSTLTIIMFNLICDANFLAQVMRLNKVGSFTMANLGQSKSVIGGSSTRVLH